MPSYGLRTTESYSFTLHVSPVGPRTHMFFCAVFCRAHRVTDHYARLKPFSILKKCHADEQNSFSSPNAALSQAVFRLQRPTHSYVHTIKCLRADMRRKPEAGPFDTSRMPPGEGTVSALRLTSHLLGVHVEEPSCSPSVVLLSIRHKMAEQWIPPPSVGVKTIYRNIRRRVIFVFVFPTLCWE